MSPQDAVRAEALARRRACAPDEVQRKSRRITERLLECQEFSAEHWQGLRVAMYRAMPGEPDMASLEKELRERGSLLYFPRVLREPGTLEFVETSLGTSWKAGPYGIEQPVGEAPAIEPKRLDVIFVPGVAFGQAGERIGMGGGYYDRYLGQAPEALRVALAFDFQLHATLEQNNWDQPVHWVVSELREFRTSRLAEWLERR